MERSIVCYISKLICIKYISIHMHLNYQILLIDYTKVFSFKLFTYWFWVKLKNQNPNKTQFALFISWIFYVFIEGGEIHGL